MTNSKMSFVYGGQGVWRTQVSDERLRFLTSVLLQSAYSGILGFCLNQWLPLIMPLTDQNSVLHDCSGALMTWPLPSVLGQFPKPSWKCSEEHVVHVVDGAPASSDRDTEQKDRLKDGRTLLHTPPSFMSKLLLGSHFRSRVIKPLRGGWTNRKM